MGERQHDPMLRITQDFSTPYIDALNSRETRNSNHKEGRVRTNGKFEFVANEKWKRCIGG